MLTQQIALVSLSKSLNPTDLTKTAAALQKQATRDLSPIWGVKATVDYFPDLKSIPVGYWPIIIMDDIKADDAAGYHTDKHHQPYSLVQYDESWSLTCSHEMCEMLVDPYGNRLIASNSIKPGQDRVQYLVEVCDPCEDAKFAYSVNGILMSDFYTPDYFDPANPNGVRYSFTGAITKPREILRNGYLTWQDPQSKKWYQATFFGSAIVYKVVNGMENISGTLRSKIDQLTKNPNKIKAVKSLAKSKVALMKSTNDASVYMGDHFAEELMKFKK